MLTFNLKKEWFEKIKSGEKTHEYREYKPYWEKRIKKELGLRNEDFLYSLNSIPYQVKYRKMTHPKIQFVKGYNPKNGILFAILTDIKITSGLNTDLKIDKPVYDIEFELIKE